MKPKNTICLWYEKDALEAARFYAATFPNSEVTAEIRAPGDYPSGQEGDLLVVEFTVMGIPCVGINGGPMFKHSEAFSFQVATDTQEETDCYWTPSSATAARKANAAGAKIAGASRGKSLRVSSPKPWPPAVRRRNVPLQP